mgnify:FL=1
MNRSFLNLKIYRDAFLIGSVLLTTTSCGPKLEPPEGVELSVHKNCLKATDYKGCVDMFSKKEQKVAGVNEPQLSEKEQILIDEIKKLPNRMTRTSLMDFQSNVRDFVDAVSLAKFDQPDSEIVKNAEKLLLAFDVLYTTWQRDIDIEWDNEWDYASNLKAKETLDSLFNGNTFDIRCVKIKYVFHTGKDELSDPIFSQVFNVVKLASEQLAKDGYFTFPSKNEAALIPLLKPIDSSFNMGVGQILCEEEKKS